MSTQWKKINKHSGNIKRACKKKYQQILASNPEIVRCSFTGNRSNTTELENIIPPIIQTNKPDNNNSINIDVQNRESEETSFDNVLDGTTSSDDDQENTQLLSETDKKVAIRKRLITWATSYNITHSALRELFTIWNEAIPNFLPKDPRTILRTPKSIDLVSLENGTYWHNGLISVLSEALNSLKNISNIKSISLKLQH